MEINEAILELLKGRSTEVRWYVLASIRNSDPSIYAISEDAKSEVDEVLELIRDYLMSNIQSAEVE